MTEELWTRHKKRTPETDKGRITGCGSDVYGTEGQEGKTKGQKRDSSRTGRKIQYWVRGKQQRSNEVMKQRRKNQGRKGLAAFAPSFNCAAKFLRLPGSIWSETKPTIVAWQEVSERLPVETCACLCKNSRARKPGLRMEGEAQVPPSNQGRGTRCRSPKCGERALHNPAPCLSDFCVAPPALSSFWACVPRAHALG